MSRPENSHNILVVEDEWLIALDIEMMLEEAGHTVIGPARNVATALTLIQDNPIDAALLDVTLGSEKSFPIAEKLDELGIPLTFISAYGKQDLPAHFEKFDLLSKPITPELLTRQIARMLGEI